MRQETVEIVFEAIAKKGITFGDEFKSEILDMLEDIPSLHFPKEKDRKREIKTVFDAIAEKNITFSDEFKHDVFDMLLTVGKYFRYIAYPDCTECENFKERDSFSCFKCDRDFSQRRTNKPF